MSDSTTFVYFISAGYGPIKIGLSDNPEKRLSELQVAHYRQLHLLYTISCASRLDAHQLEAAFHRWYNDVHVLNEWFNVTPKQIAADVELLTTLAKTAIEIQQCIPDKELSYLETRAEIRQLNKSGLTGELLNAVEQTDEGYTARCPHCDYIKHGCKSERAAKNALAAHFAGCKGRVAFINGKSYTNGHDEHIQ